MNSIQSAAGSFPWYLVCLISLTLMIGQIAVLVIMLHQGRGKSVLIPAFVQFLAGFFVYTALMDCAVLFLSTPKPYPLTAFEQWLFALPWGVYLGAEILLTAALAFGIAGVLRYRRSHLTPDVIRETVNYLPAAICVCEPDGTVLLANLKMDGLCRTLTKEPLNNALKLWEKLEQLRERGSEEGKDQLMVRTPKGETWLFFRDSFTADGKEYEQIIAEDMTEQHRITEELASENHRLREVQARMREAAVRERSLVAAREITNARMTVHNQMGNVLLVGKYYMDHPENIDEAELLRLLEYNNYFLLGEVEQPDPVADPFEEALRTAAKIGVTVEVTGAVPKGAAREILTQAVLQCSANAARHAGADRMTMTLTEENGELKAAVTNNGDPPAGPVRETGGLAALRRETEAAGGTMTVESRPVFLLTLTLPTEDRGKSTENG